MGEWGEESWIGVWGEGVAEAKSGCVDRGGDRVRGWVWGWWGEIGDSWGGFALWGRWGGGVVPGACIGNAKCGAVRERVFWVRVILGGMCVFVWTCGSILGAWTLVLPRGSVGLRLLAFLFIYTLLDESSIVVGTSIGGWPCIDKISLKFETKMSGFSSPYDSRSAIVPITHK